MTTSASTRARYLVEWYDPDPTPEALARRVAAVTASAATRTDAGDGPAVTLLTAFLLPCDEVVFGVFTAGSAESVSEVCRRSGYPAGRVRPAVETVVAQTAGRR